MSPEMTPQNDSCSANRTDIQADLDQLRELFQREDENKWAIGDLLGALITEKGIKVRDLARWLNRSPGTICEYYHTAKTFPKEIRITEVPFSRHVQACRMKRKFHLNLRETLVEIQTHNLSQSRDVTRHFAQRQRVKENAQAVARSAILVSDLADLANRCHHADCLKLIPRLKDLTVKICFFDPPYGRYLGLRDGHYGQSGATACDCDNALTREAIGLTKEFLPAMEPKLASGGVILLFRPSGNIDPHLIDIMEVVERAGLIIQHELIWDKGTCKPGNGKSPFTVGSERIWVIKRRGDELINHDGSSTSDILRFPPDRKGNETPHYFTKPLKLCKFLINKHSYEGELVFEPCGCSGNFSIAAHRLKRNFIYSEINKDNFDMGNQRVYRAMEEPPVEIVKEGEGVVNGQNGSSQEGKKKTRLNPGLFSSHTDEWATPMEVFTPLNKEFNFDLDVCATPDNAKCPQYFTRQENGLRQQWQGVCWMNPPYGKSIAQWMEKAYKSSLLGATVVCLVPVRSDTV